MQTVVHRMTEKRHLLLVNFTRLEQDIATRYCCYSTTLWAVLQSILVHFSFISLGLYILLISITHNAQPASRVGMASAVS